MYGGVGSSNSPAAVSPAAPCNRERGFQKAGVCAKGKKAGGFLKKGKEREDTFPSVFLE